MFSLSEKNIPGDLVGYLYKFNYALLCRTSTFGGKHLFRSRDKISLLFRCFMLL